MRGMFGAIIVATLLGGVAGATAQQPTPAQQNAIKQACRSDYMSHCGNVPSGGAASLQCLQQNAPQLSGPCQQALAALNGGGGATQPPPHQAAPARPMSRREMTAMLRTDCGTDYRRYCSDVQMGGGRAIACLKAHGPQLSRQCQSALLQAREGQ